MLHQTRMTQAKTLVSQFLIAQFPRGNRLSGAEFIIVSLIFPGESGDKLSNEDFFSDVRAFI